jgi:hypothetical protein
VEKVQVIERRPWFSISWAKKAHQHVKLPLRRCLRYDLLGGPG